MISRLSVFFFLLFFTACLQAASKSNLYQVEVPVASQTTSDRNQSIRVALGKVLIKVTGDRRVAQRENLSSVYKRSSRYVQQYRYRLVTEDNADGESQEKRLLSVTFDKTAIDRMLRQQGLPVWGSTRPQVLAWVGFEKNGQRSLLMPDADPSTAKLLHGLADSRGLPFLLPLMDLQDQSALSASDLWGAFEQPIRDASTRYSADAVLSVRISQIRANFWRTRWSLLDQGQTRQWTTEGADLAAVLSDGLNNMADELVAQYAPASGGSVEKINMQVSGVQSFDDLLKLQAFLDKLEIVDAHEMVLVRQERAVVGLKLRGGLSAFEQAVELSGMLVAEAPEQLPVVMPEPVVTETVVVPVPENQVEEVPSATPEQGGETAMLPPEPEPQATPVLQLAEVQLFYRMQ